MTIDIRRARPDESDALTALARRAKGSWGYPPEWMAAWQGELTITPKYVIAHQVFVAEKLGHLSGMAALEIAGVVGALEHVWVEPDLHGTGVGRALVRRALQVAGREGCSCVTVVSDPGAGAFYEKLGATLAGRIRAPMPGAAERVLPVFEFDVGVFVEASASKRGYDAGGG